MRRVAALGVIVLLGFSLAFPGAALQIADARAEVERIRQEADEITRAIEDAWARQYTLESRIVELSDSKSAAEASRRSAMSELEDVAVKLYMSLSSGESLSTMMASGSVSFAAAVQYLEVTSDDVEAALNRLLIAESVLVQQVEDLELALAEQRVVAEELEVLASEVSAKLAEAQLRLDELRAAEERQRLEAAATSTTVTSTTSTTAVPETTPTAVTTTSEPTTTTTEPTTTTTEPTTTTEVGTTTTTVTEPSVGGACPVQGAVSFVDSWGAPRSGGRTHEGVDMIAARGTPVAAIYDGVLIQLSNSTLGGITIWLRSTEGDEYYYAHLDGYAPGAATGMSVSEGEIIGYVGSTGNAPDYLPHLHFEYHPGGGAAVNPYPLVKSICG